MPTLAGIIDILTIEPRSGLFLRPLVTGTEHLRKRQRFIPKRILGHVGLLEPPSAEVAFLIQRMAANHAHSIGIRGKALVVNLHAAEIRDMRNRAIIVIDELGAVTYGYAVAQTAEHEIKGFHGVILSARVLCPRAGASEMFFRR